MAQTLTADVVGDVMRAADPLRLKSATRKLAGAADGAVFAAAVDKPAASGRVQDLAGDIVLDVVAAADRETAEAASLRLTGLRQPQPAQDGEPGRQLEAFLLGRSFEAMLPAAGSSLYGDATAGGLWRSLLADELGKSVASDGIGIAALTAVGKTGAATGWPYRLQPGAFGHVS